MALSSLLAPALRPFDACTTSSSSVLDEATAFAAGFALTRLIDAAPGIDANLTITGCAETRATDICSIYTPYVSLFAPTRVSYLSVENWELIDDDADGYSCFCCMRPDFDTSRNENATFARWTLSSERPTSAGVVPLPASALMLLTALGGLAGRARHARRIKRKASAT